MNTEIYTGKVKFFNEAKGYGFIIPDNPSLTEIFFHITKVKDKVKEGDLVNFGFESTKRGMVAINVKLS